MEKMIGKVSKKDTVPPDFVMLSDPDHAVIDRYGLFNEDSSSKRPFRTPPPT